MKKLITVFFLAAISSIGAYAQTSIEECVKKAQENYPLIRKYELLDMTKDIDLSGINKSWLPKIGLYGQITGQNIVPTFPEALTGVLHQMGQDIKGLGKVQYKIGADISQTIWDGGASSLSRDIARSESEVQKTALDIELYAVRERVENIYFAILLTEEQIAQNEITLEVLNANLRKLKSLLANGVAMQSDLDMVEAQALTLSQGITSARSAVKGYREVLEILIGEKLGTASLVRPTATEPLTHDSNRPELSLFQKRLDLNKTVGKKTDVALMPKIGLFAQTYYGYPGFNYFQSMINRDLSFNIMAGIKVSWNVDALYSRKNSSRRTEINAQNILADRDLFLYNSRILEAGQREAIAGMRTAMKDDGRIIELRSNVRKAAESQLENGVIDATALLSKISEENIARLTAQLHEIQLIREIYKLKYTLNR